MGLLSSLSRMASATGSSISVVAVFEIHMLSAADASINPMTNRRSLPAPTQCRAINARW